MCTVLKLNIRDLTTLRKECAKHVISACSIPFRYCPKLVTCTVTDPNMVQYYKQGEGGVHTYYWRKHTILQCTLVQFEYSGMHSLLEQLIQNQSLKGCMMWVVCQNAQEMYFINMSQFNDHLLHVAVTILD